VMLMGSRWEKYLVTLMEKCWAKCLATRTGSNWASWMDSRSDLWKGSSWATPMGMNLGWNLETRSGLSKVMRSDLSMGLR